MGDVYVTGLKFCSLSEIKLLSLWGIPYLIPRSMVNEAINNWKALTVFNSVQNILFTEVYITHYIVYTLIYSSVNDINIKQKEILIKTILKEGRRKLSIRFLLLFFLMKRNSFCCRSKMVKYHQYHIVHPNRFQYNFYYYPYFTDEKNKNQAVSCSW